MIPPIFLDVSMSSCSQTQASLFSSCKQTGRIGRAKRSSALQNLLERHVCFQIRSIRPQGSAPGGCGAHLFQLISILHSLLFKSQHFTAKSPVFLCLPPSSCPLLFIAFSDSVPNAQCYVAVVFFPFFPPKKSQDIHFPLHLFYFRIIPQMHLCKILHVILFLLSNFKHHLSIVVLFFNSLIL